MPVLPALGGKLNSTIPTRRSARSERRRATSRETRAASTPARSMQTCMSRAVSDAGNTQARAQPVHMPPEERPPNTIGFVAPSSSGMATMMVDSTGSRPRSDPPHWSSVWNSTGWAAR